MKAYLKQLEYIVPGVKVAGEDKAEFLTLLEAQAFIARAEFRGYELFVLVKYDPKNLGRQYHLPGITEMIGETVQAAMDIINSNR